ncbi:MAG: hypothetical protein IJN03_03165 [Bacilli bacterium]|nr:hypothetical protein [Bacilli bacterium]
MQLFDKKFLKSKYTAIFSIILSSITVMAINLSLSQPVIPQNVIDLEIYNFSFFRLLVNFVYSIEPPTWFSVLLCVPLAYFYNEIFFKQRNRKISFIIITLSAFIIFFFLICSSFNDVASWDLVFANKKTFLKSIFKTLGLTPLLYIVLDYLLNKTFIIEDINDTNFKSIKIIAYTTLFFMLCWGVYFILLYPGCLTRDATDQIAQIFNNRDVCWSNDAIVLLDENVILNNHHPMLYTVILRFILWIARCINSYSMAFQFLCFIQALLMALSFSYMIYVMKKHGLKRNYVLIAVLFCAFNPLFPIYAMTIVKDTIFCIVFLLTAVQLYELFTVKNIALLRLILFSLTIVAILFTKNNSSYILLTVILGVVFLLWKKKKKLFKITASILIPLLVVQIGFINILYPILKISPGSKREMLSVPFVQTARYIKEYPDEISNDDAIAIAKVLNCDNDIKKLANWYKPELADSVKNKFNKYSTNEDLLKYFKVWGKGLIKHPGLYIETYLNLHHGWFSFEGSDYDTYATVAKTRIDEVIPFENSTGNASMRELVNNGMDFLKKNPFATIFLELSTYTWLYLFLLFYGLKHKNKNSLVVILLPVVNYLVYFIGPIAYMRYAMPMVCTAPFYIFITLKNKD